MSICTTPMCDDGKASVERMRATFDNLSNTNPAFQRARFEPTVVSIETSFQAEWSWYDDLIPFNPVCCTIADIGSAADTLTNQMLASIGAAPVEPISKPTSPFDSITILAGVAIAAYLFVNIYHSRH